MISHIEGRVAEKRAGELVIDVNGVGFLLLCPASTVAAAPAAGETFRCYTHFSVYDGGMDLYGFASKEDREMFRRLCSVSGVGSRTALGVLSTLSLRDLSLAILTGDAASIARAPNVGKKTAQRIILELKDKVDQQDVDMGGAPAAAALNPDAAQEAVQALLALGYSGTEAQRAVNAVRDKADTADMLILLALKGLGG
ncbi:MAG: Holliday junction branch migration protein RuvA [Clostridiales bacterium]|nr:Holliday junction branch migration protein RuvA [Clostridiales bacterium]MDY2836293.1 Holliday junction branch migration protein RuvA [Candidatus Aphodomonas sp.]